MNQFFGLRYPGVHIVSLVAELVAFPIGVFLAHVLPISRLNPDRHFNIKEHALVTIMSNVSFGFGSADATNIIQAAKLYGFTLQTGFSVMVVLCCQLLGYGVAGLSARWLVEPVRQCTVPIPDERDNPISSAIVFKTGASQLTESRRA